MPHDHWTQEEYITLSHCTETLNFAVMPIIHREMAGCLVLNKARVYTGKVGCHSW